MRWAQRKGQKSKIMGRERESILVVERNNKKFEKNEYFIEISCKIDKLMCMFCKSYGVK